MMEVKHKYWCPGCKRYLNEVHQEINNIELAVWKPFPEGSDGCPYTIVEQKPLREEKGKMFCPYCNCNNIDVQEVKT